MQQTNNYGLNQWERTDRIRMEDFNGDNEKVDAALKGLAEALAAETAAREEAIATEAGARESAVSALTDKTTLHTLKTVTMSADSSAFTVDVSDIDWSQWKLVHLCMEFNGNGSFYLGYNSTYTNNSVCTVTGNHRLTLWPLYSANQGLSGILFSLGTPSFVGPGVYYDGLSTISFHGSIETAMFYAGSKVTIIGEK